MFKPSLDDIQPYVPGQSIESIKQLYNLDEIIKLASNENPLGPAVDYKTCISNISHYPDYNTHPLIPAIATKHNVEPNQIILGNGSDEILQLVAFACINPGDEILSSDCTFSEYKFVAQITGANYISAAMENHTYSVQNLIAAITDKTKIIFIANPNNPTGTIITHDDIARLLKHTSANTLVVLDEAYAEYVTATNYPQSLELTNQYPNLIITRTFSKIYGLAGCRVGYGIGQTKTISSLQKVSQPFNVNNLALECAFQALKNNDFVKKSIENNQKGKQYLIEHLSTLDCTIPNSEGNFLYINFNSIDGHHLSQLLLKQGLIVRSMKSFGQPNAIRVTIGTQYQNKRFMKELKLCLKKI